VSRNLFTRSSWRALRKTAPPEAQVHIGLQRALHSKKRALYVLKRALYSFYQKRPQDCESAWWTIFSQRLFCSQRLCEVIEWCGVAVLWKFVRSTQENSAIGLCWKNHIRDKKPLWTRSQPLVESPVNLRGTSLTEHWTSLNHGRRRSGINDYGCQSVWTLPCSFSLWSHSFHTIEFAPRENVLLPVRNKWKTHKFSNSNQGGLFSQGRWIPRWKGS